MISGSLGTLASFTTNTGRHDLAEILLKVALNPKHQSVIRYNRISKLSPSSPIFQSFPSSLSLYIMYW